MNKTLFNNLIFTLVGKGLELVIFYIIQILLTKNLETSEFGIYSKWLISANYAILILSMGLNNSLLYFSTSKRINIWNSIIVNALTYIILSCILVLVLFVFDFGLVEKNFFILFTLFSLLFTTFVSIPMIFENFFIYNIFNLLRRLFSIIFLSVVFFRIVIPNALNVMQFDTLSLILLTILCIIWSIFFLRYKEIFQINSNLKLLVEYFKYGFKSIFLNFLGLSVYSIDVFIVSYFLDSISIAYYVIAGSIVKITWFFIDNSGTVFFPKFILNYNNNNNEESIKIINITNQISFLITILLTLLFVFFGKDFLSLLYKSDYQKAYLSTIILLLGSHGMVIYKLYSRYLASKNSFNLLYYSLSLSILLNVSLNFALIPKWGIEGAAFSSFVSYWFCGLFIVYLSRFNLLSLFSFQELRTLLLHHLSIKRKNN
ncbi:MAG: polysaccharide biosynthesis C-terminal domain-containing protein [Bacteroidota bacterium]